MQRYGSVSQLFIAVVVCANSLLLADSVTNLWWAAPVAVGVGPFLVLTDRFGRAERNVGLFVVAGGGVLSLYGMLFAPSVVTPARLAPLFFGVGVGMAASALYAVAVRPTVEVPAS